MDLRQKLADWTLSALYGKEYISGEEYKIGLVAAREVSAIHRRFEQLGVKALIDVTGIIASSTGNFIRYPLNAYGKIASIESIEDDLSTVVSTLRGVETEVRVRKPLLAIELPYPLPTRPLLWSDANVGTLRSFQALLGMDYTRHDPEPAIIDFGRKTIAHALIAGATGSGKSVLVIGLLLSLCHSTAPDQLTILFADPKFDPGWAVLADLPHVSMRSEPADVVAMIASVKAELERRKRHPDSRKLLLVIDEYADFLGDLDKETRAQVEQHIVSITSVGRSLGIHVILITQKPTVEIVDTVAKGNLTTRICGSVTTPKESEIGMGRGNVGCENLPGEGSFYVTIGGGRILRIQSYLVEGEALEDAITVVCQKYAKMPPYRIQMAATVAGATTPQMSEDERNAARILEEYDYGDLFDDKGKVRSGMQLAAVKVLFGDDATNAGAFHKETKAALAVIKGQHITTTTRG